MLCDVCKTSDATVHIVRIVNGVKQEMRLCENCAGHSKEAAFASNLNFGDSFSFQNVLSGLVEYINQSPQGKKTSEVACPVCGTTYTTFKQSGLMGCGNCYSYFSNALVPIIKRVQGNIEHVGKVPLKIGKDIMEKRKLIKLKEDLQNAILLEEYEKAAQLRDEIRKIQSGEGTV